MRISGGWNIDASRQLWGELSEIAGRFEGQPWAILGDLRQWGLSTPDSVALGAEVSSQLDDLGRTHTAMVVGQEILARIIVERAFKTSDRKAPLHFFENEPAAWQWLAQSGFEPPLNIPKT